MPGPVVSGGAYGPIMSIPAVEDSWGRIDAWLLRHAPVSHALLRPPASTSDIRAAERALGVRFHSDLVASLSCHDGVELQPGAPVLTHYGPLSCVADIVKNTSFLRGISADVPDDHALDEDGEDDGDDGDDDELATYWHHDWLLITLGIGWQSSDGLFLSCHPGRNWGRLGRYFDEDTPSFTGWVSLRHALADLADALERGRPFDGRTPLAYEGALLWEAEATAVPDPVSPLALAAESAEPEPEPLVPVGGSNGAYLAMVRHRIPPPPPPNQPDVVFAEHLTPAELLRRLGAIPDTVSPRTRARARKSADSTWAAYRPMVRAGSADGWAYATQERGAAQFTRSEVLRRVSADTRAVALTRRGPEVQVTVAEDGVPGPEDVRHVLSPREGGGDLWPGSTAAYARFLAELEGEFGITYRPDDDTDAELTSALLLPALEDVDRAAGQYVGIVRNFDLAALIERTPPARLRTAVAAQLGRLAAGTRFDVYDEVSDALARTARGETVDLTPDSGLDLRIRTLTAEAWAARQRVSGQRAWCDDNDPVTQSDFSAWALRVEAARALREFVHAGAPAAAATILSRRMSAHWRTELAADLEG
ncbi:hypothetical protein GCM10010317_042800 [Streptomyces mirabilis]|nr:hypothetical protein GCM10010317_042800 [Streptomyces mirabilis]